MNTALPHHEINPGSFEGRRLQRAMAHINQYWFPPNSAHFAKIKTSLHEGYYDLGMEFLLQDLKRDYALYIYCLRELSRLLHEDGVELKWSEPLKLLETAGIERVKKVLAVELQGISQHAAESLTGFQARQFEASMISASTAEVLCERGEIVPDSAHLTALLRQLGLTLIAWNYPIVYQRALATQTQDKNLDAMISEKLGFSPLMLAISVIKEWGLAPELEQAVSGAAPAAESNAALSPKQQRAVETAGYLSGLCRIGEALARANQPETYPTAALDWREIKDQIETILGREGLKTIQTRVNDYCTSYRAQNPKLFRDAVEINPELHIHIFSDKVLLKNNHYVEQCPPLLKKRFKDFYESSSQHAGLREAVANLVKDIFPLTEFSGGCVYTLDTGAASLIPRLRMGKLDLRTLSPLPFQDTKHENDPVWTAFQCTTPISGHVSPKGLSFIAGRLGSSSGPPVGVLYVEISSRLLFDPASTHLVHFKALRQTFQDLLGLKGD